MAKLLSPRLQLTLCVHQINHDECVHASLLTFKTAWREWKCFRLQKTSGLPRVLSKLLILPTCACVFPPVHYFCFDRNSISAVSQSAGKRHYAGAPFAIWTHESTVISLQTVAARVAFSLGRLLVVSYQPVFHSASQRTWHSAMLCLPSSQVWCSQSWWMCPAGLLFSLKADTSTNAAASSTKDSLIDSFPCCCSHW